MRSLSITFIYFLAALSAWPAIRYVSTDSPSPGVPYDAWSNAAHTVEDAVSVSLDGDTILVTNGVHVIASPLSLTNGVWLKSVNGHQQTALRLSGEDRSLVLAHPDAGIDGFTITNYGPNVETGVLISNGVLRACLLDGQQSQYYDDLSSQWLPGNGMLYPVRIEGGLAESCTVTRAVYRGVWISGGTVKACDIHGNVGYPFGGADRQGGGGVYSEGGLVTESTITNNIVYETGGGGVYVTGTGVVAKCIIQDNATSAGSGSLPGTIDGSAAYVTGGGLLDACIILSNRLDITFQGNGAGTVYCVQTGRIQNCSIYKNTISAPWNHDPYSGIYMSDDAGIVNCTIVGNNHGGIYRDGGTVLNTIIWSNAGQNVAGALDNYSYCLTDLRLPGSGHETNMPLFVDSAGGDYRLLPGSTGIDDGTTNGAPAYDIRGNTRPFDGNASGTAEFDIGSHEYPTIGADSDGDGLSDEVEVAELGTNPFKLDTDGDMVGDYEEMVADTDGADSNSVFTVTRINAHSPVTVTFSSSASRVYTLMQCENLEDGNWSNLPGFGPRAGAGGSDYFQVTNENTHGHYSIRVELP